MDVMPDIFRCPALILWPAMIVHFLTSGGQKIRIYVEIQLKFTTAYRQIFDLLQIFIKLKLKVTNKYSIYIYMLKQMCICFVMYCKKYVHFTHPRSDQLFISEQSIYVTTMSK